MTVHTIRLPDMRYGRELRTILWDDEAAIVEGDHSKIPWMRERIAAAPTELVNRTCTIPLKDPGRDPREFWRLLIAVFYPVAREPLRSTMPAILRDVEPSELVIHPSSLSDLTRIRNNVTNSLLYMLFYCAYFTGNFQTLRILTSFGPSPTGC